MGEYSHLNAALSCCTASSVVQLDSGRRRGHSPQRRLRCPVITADARSFWSRRHDLDTVRSYADCWDNAAVDARWLLVGGRRSFARLPVHRRGWPHVGQRRQQRRDRIVRVRGAGRCGWHAGWPLRQRRRQQQWRQLLGRVLFRLLRWKSLGSAPPSRPGRCGWRCRGDLGRTVAAEARCRRVRGHRRRQLRQRRGDESIVEPCWIVHRVGCLMLWRCR